MPRDPFHLDYQPRPTLLRPRHHHRRGKLLVLAILAAPLILLYLAYAFLI